MAAGDLALRIIITATGAQAVGEIEAVKSAVAEAGTGISRNMLMAGAAVATFGIIAIKMAGDFQQQMIHLQALAGLTAQQMQTMSNQILAMAPEVGQTPLALSKALFQVVSSLVPANEQMSDLYYSGILASTGMANVTDVAAILSTIMKIYGMSASTAANDVTLAVTYGRMTMTDYANSIGLVIQKGNAAGFSFNELNAALDVLTTHGFPSSQQAARNLGQLFVQMDLGMDALAKRASGMGLAFNESAFKTMSLADQINYLNEITGGNAQELHKLIGGGVYAFQTFEALSNGMKDYTKILGLLGNAQKGVGAAQAAWTTTQQGFNVQVSKGQAALQVLMITIGNVLLPVVGNIIGAFATWTGKFVGWLNSGHAVNDALSLTGKYAQIALPILAGLGALILAIVVPALWSMAAALLANPITWIVLGVVALTAAFVHWYQTNAGFKAFMDQVGVAFKQLGGWIMTTVVPALKQFGGWLQTNVLPPMERVWNAINKNFVPTLQTLGNFFMTRIWPILQAIGGYLVSAFVPVWKQLQEEWSNIILPALKQLWAALQPLMPIFKLIGGIILFVVIIAFGLLVALITGLIKGFAGLLQGATVVIGGIVQIFTGLIQFVTGIVRLIYDIIMGNWGKLGDDVKTIFQGIYNFIGGIFHAIGGVFMGLGQGMLNALQGFWDGIVGFFYDLWDKLTGHSIVVDLVNDVVNWFGKIPGNVMTAVASLPGKFVSWAGGMAKDALTWGANILKNLAAGIINNISQTVGNAMSSLGNFISSHLPHSPAKMGPLRELEAQGANIPGQIAAGILKGAPKLQTALKASLTLPTSLIQQNAFALHAPNQNQQMNMTINLDGRQLTQAIGIRMAKEIRIQGNVRGR